MSMLSSVSGLHPICTIRTMPKPTLPPHPHPPPEPGCTATCGCACPSMFPFAWRNFHHKPALVAPIILWLEYFLCTHHTIFPKFQLLGTRADLPGPAFLPTWPFMACAPPCAPFRTPPHTSVVGGILVWDPICLYGPGFALR